MIDSGSRCIYKWDFDSQREKDVEVVIAIQKKQQYAIKTKNKLVSITSQQASPA
jgi:hypothetical protein